MTRGFWAPVERARVIAAMDEHDQLGAQKFLMQYGFGRAKSFVLKYRRRSYPSKAILGVAYGFATGGPALKAHEFSGGTAGAAGVLRRLGFTVEEQ